MESITTREVRKGKRAIKIDWALGLSQAQVNRGRNLEQIWKQPPGVAAE